MDRVVFSLLGFRKILLMTGNEDSDKACCNISRPQLAEYGAENWTRSQLDDLVWWAANRINYRSAKLNKQDRQKLTDVHLLICQRTLSFCLMHHKLCKSLAANRKA